MVMDRLEALFRKNEKKTGFFILDRQIFHDNFKIFEHAVVDQ